MVTAASLLIAVVVLCVTHFVLKRWKFFKLPSPGLELPVIGHIHLMLSSEGQKDPVNFLWNLWRKHNQHGMMYLKMLKLNLMFVGDYETIKYIYNHQDVQGRMTGTGIDWATREDRKIKSKEMPGVILSEGKTWVEQRRFALRNLRDFGFGKQGMEEMIQEEVEMFKALINKSKGEPFDFINKLNLPILNALWRISVGDRFEYDNPKLVSIVKRLTEVFKRFGKPENGIILSFPLLTKIFPKFLERDESTRVQHEIMDLMMESVKQHQETLDVNAPRDFTDIMLIEIQKTTDPASSFYGEFGIENLVNVMMDLFVAGSETTSTTLTWAMLYMIRYPKVQKKVQEELDKVVGQNRHPSIKDRQNLPYTEAVIMEIQRYANIIPTGVQHISQKEFTVHGITIPPYTLIQPLLTEILKGSHWGDGEVFRPERFLDANGKVVKDDHLMPFSIGKRQCLGETLAKVELYLFFSNIVHQYNIEPENVGVIPTEEYQQGVTLLPKAFKARLSNRF